MYVLQITPLARSTYFPIKRIFNTEVNSVSLTTLLESSSVLVLQDKFPVQMPAIKRKRGPQGIRASAKSARNRASMSSARGGTRKRNLRLGGFLGIQKKFFDTSRDANITSSSIAGSESDPTTKNTLFCPVQGSGENDRDGSRAQIKSVTVQGNVRLLPLSGTATPPAVTHGWMALVLDKQTNASQLNAEDVFETSFILEAIEPFRNLEFESRFEVLHLQKFSFKNIPMSTISAGTSQDYGAGIHSFKMETIADIPVQFKANAGTVSDIVDNSLHVICLTNATNTCRLEYNARCRFVG